MDKLRRGFSAGKQLVASCLHCMFINANPNCKL